MMRVTTAGIAERKGCYFVAKRKPGSSLGGIWEFPGGKKRDHETPEEALKREFKEEFNLDISVGNLLWTGKFNNGDKKYLLQAYKICMLTENIRLFEHETYRWADLNTLKTLDMPESDRMLLEFLSSLKQI